MQRYKLLRGLCAVACIFFSTIAFAAEYHGQVTFNGLPVPGAIVTVTRDSTKYVAVTDLQGNYTFADLASGPWKIQIEMTGFATSHADITVPAAATAVPWELKLLSLNEIRTATNAVKIVDKPAPVAATPQVAQQNNAAPKTSAPAPVPEKPSDENTQRAADGFLINGSVNNAATSQYALPSAFGNTRNGGKGLYTGGIYLVINNSALDARPFSLTGLNTARTPYDQANAGVSYGGPLKIPHLIPLYKAPYFFLNYQWTRNTNDSTVSALMPDSAERSGNLSELPQQIYNPSNGTPYGGNIVPVSSQAQALLAYYPLPNVTGSTGYNYQAPILSSTHQDNFMTRVDKSFGYKNQVYGLFAIQSVRSSSPNVFSFVDSSNILGINSNVNWNHEFSRQLFITIGYAYSRLQTQVHPYFENRINVSGQAGITGNDQDPADWAPPTLGFSSGIAGLSDTQSANNRNQTGALSASVNYYRGRHNVTVGGDFRRQEFNYYQQQNPQGTFTFTGAATQKNNSGGSDLADFLIGIPDTSAIAYGNADKYFRESVYDAYIRDDWRLRPELTINAGLRWEYGAPITELFGRLVNLDIAQGFTAVAPVVASNPIGSLTGNHYPTSLIQPDKFGVEPRIGISWRPFSGSSVVVRGGYGLYQDTSIYQTTALNMAQQPPQPSPSKSLSVQNSSTCPLTLANGFVACSGTTPDTFAVDPNFHVGYAQAWQLQVQRDLPAALVMIATYSGIKGTHGVQEYLPNTYPIGATSPCPSCPVGFAYRTSNGESSREAGQVQLRRRLRSGFTASVQYTYSKSIDDDASLGGQGPVAAGAVSQSTASPAIAQNWQNLTAERGLSSFDQRNLLNVTMQYTTGMGLGGSTLLEGWKGRAYKEWTVMSSITAGSGMPETPTYYAAVPGTGVTGSMRGQTTGASVYAAPSGLFLNPAAYTAPPNGQWGNAGRNSITGPGQFAMNASLARTFRVKSRYNLDIRFDSTNVLNHVTYSSYFTTVASPQFGLPSSTSAMRSVQTTVRLRF